ncbi:hypothetical protein LTR37_007716 [Vermiconidia calcicola]|uniref:Uncharacterized protein n=1 Tax=Vermiconidia calcicola TaxID=1690605 RepID=A0ACC3NCY6_9PEZI|nr:hypothetical protein LTR37_007716 [Vermiconidia calcicola]
MSSEPLNSDSETGDEDVKVEDTESSTERMKEASVSPPSSPPVVKENISQDMPPATGKRPHEEMIIVPEEAEDSSATFVGEGEATTSQSRQVIKTTDPPSTFKPSTQAHSMPPPQSPASSMGPPSQKPPRSGQGTVSAQSSQSPPARPGSTQHDAAKQQKPISDVSDESSDDTVESDSAQVDPQAKIENFDWQDLQQRYHDKIAELDATEHNILGEFNSLCDYFSVWAQTGSHREVDRSFKRLKTQMTLVQHHESELEAKRQHYIQVVNAFKIAMLLGDPDFADVVRKQKEQHGAIKTSKESHHALVAPGQPPHSRTPATTQLPVYPDFDDIHPARCIVL